MGRREKLDLVFQKAVDSVMDGCGFDEVRKIFPEELSVRADGEKKVSVLEEAYDRTMEFFRERMMRDWKRLVDEYGLEAKLEMLDGDIDRDGTMGGLVQTDPGEIVREIVVDVGRKEAKCLARKIADAEKARREMEEQIGEKRREIEEMEREIRKAMASF